MAGAGGTSGTRGRAGSRTPYGWSHPRALITQNPPDQALRRSVVTRPWPGARQETAVRRAGAKLVQLIRIPACDDLHLDRIGAELSIVPSRASSSPIPPSPRTYRALPTFALPSSGDESARRGIYVAFFSFPKHLILNESALFQYPERHGSRIHRTGLV